MSAADRVRAAVGRTLVGSLSLWERLESGVSWNLTSRGFLEDPQPSYRRLREKSPVHRSRLVRGWVFSRYDDCLALLRDRRLSSDFRHSKMWARALKMQLAAGRTLEELERPTMLNSDPPRHTRLRGLVSKAFTPRAVRALEGRMVEIVDEMLAARAGASEIDIVEDLAYPLPVIVIAEMLGIPAEDRDRFKHWSQEAVRGLAVPNLDDLKASVQAGRELYAYLEPIAAERKREPRDDLLSGLLQAEEAGDRLSMEEVYQTVSLLLIAGNETTTKLIGNGMLALLRHPEQLELLRQRPELIDTAVDELLRWDGPVHMTGRNAVESFEYKGANIQKGQMVAVALAAANRDPAVFDDPEQLDITRIDNPHLAFGHGLHFCLGSSLAKLEARTAIGALVSRYPSMKLATERPQWGSNLALRGLDALPIRV